MTTMTTANTTSADAINAFLEANETRLAREFPYGVSQKATDNDIKTLRALFEKEKNGE
jgi:hypothetical protein